ncbi:ABC transporter permease [Fulvivirga sedimenti]|uniref:ABC transporter permease n=1 Tax=Fulvivirga sedimenti TaxID=2879465 RepID=A0A9X1HMJ1_9BACT|nr:ABC transporter permease [Fulvivirga sedimenti]MCA6074893.1 ABC transporter permease [Fulvivirga sedimenti]MCA6076070.1 ABC transporter permease [Fulvivirga sedimenti]MCA6077198.1 ABC transporter permease [Fulvivirga sedimenti]
MKRKKATTAMNVFGMALTFLICMAIFSYVSHEMSFDKYHKNVDRIYRVTYRFQNANGYDIQWARMNQTWVNELPNSFPQIDKLVRFQSFRTRDIQIGSNNFRENYAYAVDKEVFDLFDFEIVKGSLAESLTPYTVVLTTTSAQKYFGSEDPIGETMEISNDLGIKETYKVSAVIKDPPSNTHLPITLLTSINSENERTGWAYVYMLLKDKADIQSIQEKMPDFIADHENLADEDKLTVNFQPLTSIHLHSNLSREIVANGNIKYVVIFIFVGLFLLIIGTVNFINLNTIQSLERIKEFGLRQSFGAPKGEMKVQMVLEALIIALFSAAIALVVFTTGLKYFEQFVGHSLVFSYLEMVLGLIALTGLISLVSALITGLSMMRIDFGQIGNWFKPSASYKSVQKYILLGLQFSAMLLLITSMVIIQRQFTYMTQKNLGYESDQILVLRNNNREVMRKYKSFKNELKRISGVLDLTAVMEVPSVPVKDQGPVTVLGDEQNTISADMQVMDLNAPELLGIEFIAGSQLPQYLQQSTDQPDSVLWENFATKQRAYLINESACKKLGWSPEEAIGQQINWSIGDFSLQHGPVTGVIRDFHQESLNEQIRPVVITYEPLWVRHMLVKINSDDHFGLYSSIEDLWKNTFPDQPLEISNLDYELEQQYLQEKKQLKLISSFTFLAILIAFIGLYGMMAYTIKLRLKELAIRRVLGSNWLNSLRLLSREYMILALVSMIIVFPLAYWLMNGWLANYAYHISINGTGFLLSGGLLFMLISLTLTYQITVTTNKNPSTVLRGE